MIRKIAEHDALYVQNANNLKYVKQFAEPNKCRRQILLNYFDNGNKLKYNKHCCDYCDNPNGVKIIKLKYEKMRKGKDNVIGDVKDDFEVIEEIEEYDYDVKNSYSDFNCRGNGYEGNSNSNNKNSNSSGILLNGERTGKISGMKIETREHGLFEFLSVVEENVKGIGDNGSGNVDVFKIAQDKELEVFNKANTSFIYGLNLRTEIENIKKCTLYGLLWNEFEKINQFVNSTKQCNNNDGQMNNNVINNNIDAENMNVQMDSISNRNMSENTNVMQYNNGQMNNNVINNNIDAENMNVQMDSISNRNMSENTNVMQYNDMDEHNMHSIYDRNINE
eukprot:426274_1